MTARGYTFGICERCERETRLSPVAGEWICKGCAAKARPVPPVAGQLEVGDDPLRRQIGPGDDWPAEDF